MKKKSKLIVSFLWCHKKLLHDMKLRILFLLFGAISVFYASNAQDNSMASSNINTFGNLFAFATNKINTSGQLDDNNITGISEDVQQKIITGRITDSKGEALSGVSVIEKGTINGLITDSEGKFSIKVASGNAILVFSFIGYTSQEVTVGSQTSFNISLAESAIRLDEIVVIGYGTVKKRDVTGSVASLKGEEMRSGVQVSVDQMLYLPFVV
jgi:CarboxypepD_reg-like domain